MTSLTLRKLCFSLALLACLFVFSAFAQDKEWRPLSVEDRTATTPVVEPDADAEVLFWEIRVDDSTENLVMKHYVRVKIFTERGREKYSKVDIPFRKGIRIKDIMARVTKVDGTVSELAKADVFDREIAKTDKIKVRAKSFAIPNIEPGVVVEYKYQEVYTYGSAEDMRMIFQHDVPVRSKAYYFKPAMNAKYLTFNMSDNKFVKDKNGYYKASMENVPAIKEEPNMPPEDEVRSWLLLYYTDAAKSSTANDFWSRAGYSIVKNWEIKDTLKPGKELKAAAATIAAGVTDPEEQMAKLFAFCKTNVKNISFDTSLTEEQKDDVKPNKSTADTYKRLQGTTTDINELFASLATSLGYETRLAFGGDRSEKFFDPGQAHESFIHFSSVAVKINGKWKYYSPGDKFVPYGLLAWNEEATSVLLLGYKDYVTTETPYSSPQESVAKRTGKFTLSEDGTLTGTVKIEYTGHLSNEFKLDNYKESASKQEEMLKDMVQKGLSTAELSEMSIENVSDPEKPFTYKYKIVVPKYAQKTGKRMFIQPGVFESGSSPAFSTATRKYQIFFHHPWSEEDDIELKLPKGFELDNADVPRPIADPSNISSLNIQVGADQKNGVLVYKRRFSFGSKGYTLFPASSYQPLKGLFDAFHNADTHMLTIKQL
ncbi:MAG: DUF3857 and transglutaminase domain-containing protein [Acidobacteria bacterium]|nr:DUF3857 and transglutaminase domain-containing protein [Acidobacteriota bacterium]